MRRKLYCLLALLCAPTAVLAQAAPPTLHPFDPNHLQVHHIDSRWVLVADNVFLRDFGPREADAREALRVIHALHLNQVGTVGAPVPGLEFWLTDGHPPLPTAQGLNLQPIDLNTLHVEEMKHPKLGQGQPLPGQWVVRDKKRVLGVFGDQRDQAFQALDLIRQYGFTQQGVIGQPFPTMTYFVADPSEKVRYDAMQATAAQKAPAGATPQPGSTADRLRFDARLVEVREDHHQWKLVFGRQTLANFGTDQHAAKQAQQVVNYYHFTEQCVIGSPENGFRYFLVNGQPPVGVRFGVQMQPLRPEALMVQQIGDQCIVCDGTQPLLRFGNRLADAQQFVRVVQRYHFDRLCSVGGPEGQGMTFFVKSR